MSDFAKTWTNPVVEDWEAGDFIRTDKLRDQAFQPLMYLKDQIDTFTTLNYWSLYEQRLQSGLIPGSPFA